MTKVKIISILLMAVVLILLFFTFYQFINTSNNTNSTTGNDSGADTDNAVNFMESCHYNDGIYIGVGTGKTPGTEVSVTIEDDKICEITVVNSRDYTEYMDQAAKVIIPQIITTQSTAVDTVTGASYSSRGILQAVNDALSQAVVQ